MDRRSPVYDTRPCGPKTTPKPATKHKINTNTPTIYECSRNTPERRFQGTNSRPMHLHNTDMKLDYTNTPQPLRNQQS